MPDGDKKYYWLKLKKDFFKRHDIRIIEAMPNGKDYVLFYLKLLVESVDHEGMLRFNDTIPYNENMLSTITNTNIDIVRSAMKLFVELNMIELLEDETIYMSEVEKMLGAEGWSASRVRRFRERNSQNKEVKALHRNTQVTIGNTPVTYGNVELEIEIEKDIEIDKVKTSCASKSMHDAIDECFEACWKLFPRKRGKSAVSKKAKEAIAKVGYDKMAAAIKAYVADFRSRPGDRDESYMLNGSTWFNGRYADWLDVKAATQQSPVEAAGYRYVTAEDESI